MRVQMSEQVIFLLGAIDSLQACVNLHLRVTSNQGRSSVATVTLWVSLAHPFSTDGTAKSHVVTLFLVVVFFPLMPFFPSLFPLQVQKQSRVFLFLYFDS
ncbi:hypothetical protein ILYODFUR_015531 [Ilyodon furcidens]|uniref:Secreted protein n=1 Tax=Ilyodon furcidens TaxID=33524 RepID=A0ABV0VE88_9TELE